MPTHNYGCFIEEAIKSVLDQTYQDFELIIIDDGSSDDTGSVIEKYRDRLTYIQKEHHGQTHARQIGIDLAKGDYFCFLDADDMYEKDMLKTQVSFLEKYPDIDFIFSDSRNFDEKGLKDESFMSQKRRFHKMPFKKEGIYRVFSQSLFEAYLYENFIVPSTMLIRRNYMKHVGIFENRYDGRVVYGKMLFTIHKARIAYTDKVLLLRRWHDNNVSNQGFIIDEVTIDIFQKLLNDKSIKLSKRQKDFAVGEIAHSYYLMGKRNFVQNNINRARHNFTKSIEIRPVQIKGYILWVLSKSMIQSLLKFRKTLRGKYA